MRRQNFLILHLREIPAQAESEQDSSLGYEIKWSPTCDQLTEGFMYHTLPINRVMQLNLCSCWVQIPMALFKNCIG